MDTIYVVGHKNPDTDSICSAIAYAGLKEKIGISAKAASSGEINDETRFVLGRFGFAPPDRIGDASGKKLVLVDHNEAQQSPDNADKAQIIEVIDHHKIDFKCSVPVYFRNEPVGCTATIIADMYEDAGVKITGGIAGLLLSAILSDTVVFKSQTTTEKDRAASKRLAKIAGIKNTEEFGIEVKTAKASLAGKSAEALIFMDYKDFTFNGKKVGIGQIEVVGMEEVNSRKAELIAGIASVMKKNGNDAVLLMATDIIAEGTDLLATGNIKPLEKAFGKKISNDSVYLPKVMSRKKDVVPLLEKAF
ncbi:MAG: manganese-dependent inorganic pyrophosphatase [Candidatus Altiarchaeales archaeon IMC4]|nr:MAG: manganese-dependent inorganic pyrophosphatase [Candidatus Altiarchaeales archaeon IMC4]